MWVGSGGRVSTKKYIWHKNKAPTSQYTEGSWGLVGLVQIRERHKAYGAGHRAKVIIKLIYPYALCLAPYATYKERLKAYGSRYRVKVIG